jgi:hypothetical protein
LELAEVEALEGASPALAPTTPVVTELLDPNPVMKIITEAYPDVPADQFARSLHAAIDGDMKLIRASDGTNGLYNLSVDPGEGTNLYGTHGEEAAALGAKLRTWLDVTPAYDPQKRAEDDKPVKPKDQQVRQQLQALGYLDE